jgi:hypothetical protein
VRQGVAEVDQEPIAEVLGDMPLEAGDHFGAGGLIGLHHLAQLFRIELAREHGRVHQVTKQHRQLAAFGVRRVRCGDWGGPLGRVICLADRRWGVLGCWRSWRLGHCCVTGPAQATTRVLDHLWVRVEEFVLEDRQLLVVQVELELQRAIRHAASALQEGHDLVEDIIKFHHGSSSCVSQRGFRWRR